VALTPAGVVCARRLLAATGYDTPAAGRLADVSAMELLLGTDGEEISVAYGEAIAWRAAREPAEAAAEMSEAVRELGNRVAAAGNAIHAGIGAADAITAARAAVVWKGEHSQSPAHLERVGGDDRRKAAAQLRRLKPLKNRAEYDPEPISAAETKAAVTAAARMVRIAEQTAKQVER